MAETAPPTRDTALRVAKWLVDKSRFDEALALLSSWAVSGPNDELGQRLLGEALQIDSASTVAKAAFQRMEGVAIDDAAHAAELDLAIKKYDANELTKLEGEMKRPQFLRAQVGFNNNLKYKGHDYHVQTEDSGLNKPHIITHLFADGGRIIKSHKRIYAKEVSRPDVVQYVRQLMKGQHMELVLLLRDGKFDDIIAGKVMGGVSTLDEPPNVDVQKLGSRKKKDESSPDAAPAAGAPEATADAETSVPVPAPVAPVAAVVIEDVPVPVATAPSAPKQIAASSSKLVVADVASDGPEIEAEEIDDEDAAESIAPPPIRFHLRVIRGANGTPAFYSPPGDEVILGRWGQVGLEGEVFCHPSEAIFHWKDGSLWLEDLDGGNGVFVRIKTPIELEIGDELIVGDQLLRVERNPARNNGPGPGPTYFWSSPTGPSAFRVVQVLAGGALGEVRQAGGTTMQIGSTIGDLLLGDPLVSEQHCFIEEQAGVIVLTDLESASGTFVRVRGEQILDDGDELLVGRTRLRVEVPKS